MVVKDGERVRSLSMDALHELSYTILEAPSATNVLRMIESGQPVSLMFTNVSMSNINGTALQAEMGRLWPEIEVPIATG
jgi:DNA-binding NtrC family response regulator